MNLRQRLIIAKMACSQTKKSADHKPLDTDIQMDEPLIPDSIMCHLSISVIPTQDANLALVAFIREGKAKNESFVLGYINLSDGLTFHEDLRDTLQKLIPESIKEDG